MIETFIKPMIYNKNRTITEQIAGGTYKNFDYYVLNLKHTRLLTSMSQTLL